jgi:citrate lyase subunit beta / citryl-CoA lyase
MFRSQLYVPTSSERFVAKAHERGADAIILDLEDSVAPAQKDAARAALAAAVPSVTRNGASAFVRINSEDARYLPDAEAACRAGAFGLFVPKSRDPRRIAALAARLDEVERAIGRTDAVKLVLMIEDPGAVFEARAIAAASPRTFGLCVGGEDIATAMAAEPTPEVLRLPKLMVHMAAKAAGVHSFGLLRTVADYQDVAAIEKAAHEARTFGFDGASCVHPSAIPILNRVFAPSAEELDYARRMIAAFEASLAAGAGAFEFKGRMIDIPVVARARALIARHEARAKR